MIKSLCTHTGQSAELFVYKNKRQQQQQQEQQQQQKINIDVSYYNQMPQPPGQILK